MLRFSTSKCSCRATGKSPPCCRPASPWSGNRRRRTGPILPWTRSLQTVRFDLVEPLVPGQSLEIVVTARRRPDRWLEQDEGFQELPLPDLRLIGADEVEGTVLVQARRTSSCWHRTCPTICSRWPPARRPSARRTAGRCQPAAEGPRLAVPAPPCSTATGTTRRRAAGFRSE